MNFSQCMRVMKLTMLLLTCFLVQVHASSYAQRISMNRQNSTIHAVLEDIRKQAKYDFFYDMDLFNRAKPVNIQVKNATVEQVLNTIFKGQPYIYTIDNRLVVITEAERDAATSALKSTNMVPKAVRQQPGRISGKVMDEHGEPLPSASIKVVQTGQVVQSSSTGDYSLNVPSGSYTIEISYISFQTKRVTEVEVKSGHLTHLNIVLNPATNALDQVVVSGTFKKESTAAMYVAQKNRTALSDGISAEMIKNTSDNNVGEVLGRISGIMTEKGNRFVNIRGLGDRYNAMQLNGSSLPSTEANTKNFSFDVIPSSLVENIVVNKTFTPDLPADFVGGLVNVSTLSIPKEAFLELNIGSGFNSQSTGKDFYSGRRYGSDWLFGNIEDRVWYGRKFDPDQYQLFGRELAETQGLTQQRRDELTMARNEMGASVPNTFGLRKFTGRPMGSYAFSAGRPIHLVDGGTLGYAVSATYRNEQNAQHLEEAHFRKYGDRSYDGDKYEFNTWIGGLANIGWQKNGHKVTWTNLYNSKFGNESSRRLTQTATPSLELEQFSMPLRNTLLQTKLDGEHLLGTDGLKMAWVADYNRVKRMSPDERIVSVRLISESREDPNVDNPEAANSYVPVYAADGSFIADGSSWGFVSQGNAFSSGYIRHNEYAENKKNAGLNLEYPRMVMGQKQVLKAGYYGSFRNADYEQLSLRPEAKGIVPKLQDMGQSVEDFFSPGNFSDGSLVYNPYFGRSVTTDRVRDYYHGNQDIHAAYLYGEFSFFRTLRLMGGIRMENNNTSVRTNSTGTNTEQYIFSDTVLYNRNTRFFPSVTAIYSIMKDLNLRAAFSKTVVRPDFNEITGLAYYDVYERSMVWNAKLEDTDIRNFDVRAEWYPRAGEVVSLGYFYKKFHNPVEMMSRDRDAGNYDFKKLNILNAEAKGIELNVRKSLGFINPDIFLKDFFISGNVTLLEGKTNYDMEKLAEENPSFQGDPDKFRDRPLQGMAPIIGNASLIFEGEKFGGAVNYGHIGRRAVVTGVKAYLDEFEDSRNVLDFQVSAKFLRRKLEVKFNATDVLNEPMVRYVNMGYEQDDAIDGSDDISYNKGKDRPRSIYRRGSSYSLGLTYKF